MELLQLQVAPPTLAAFEKSQYADDWRELMRLYMVRRTRSFIQDNYAEADPQTGRKFLTFADGSRSYFPTRVPKTVKFRIDDANQDDQYARLYAEDMVKTINRLNLPRYGLGNYEVSSPHEPQLKPSKDAKLEKLIGLISSNNKRDRFKPEEELRVLIATDVLSEGQNLQDCAIVVNYDLPWAIIRLVQRAGRVDRIGQAAENILCYSFLPAEGVDRIIMLRARVRQGLSENAEVVGTDEAFFEDDRNNQVIIDLYNENAGFSMAMRTLK